MSELFTMSYPSWVTLHDMAHSFFELDKAVVHVIRLVGATPEIKSSKSIADNLRSNSAKRNFVDPFGVAQRAFPWRPW